MGKNKSKKSKNKRRPLSVSPLLMLRPNLDKILNDVSLIEKDEQHIRESLDSAFSGVKGYDALPIFIEAYHNAAVAVKNKIDEVLPLWLENHDYQDELKQLFERNQLDPNSEKYVLAWLEKLGIASTSLKKIEKVVEFYKSFYFDNTFQGMAAVFWYNSKDKTTVKGMTFLLDLCPPWNGAVKDIVLIPQRFPKEAERQFIDCWEQQETPVSQITEAEVKNIIFRALDANRRENIRLPRDLINARNVFLEHILALPDSIETPSFTAADFDEMANFEQSAESIRNFEQNVGGFIRTSDGQEIFVPPPPKMLE